jgi:hypothetical protein
MADTNTPPADGEKNPAAPLDAAIEARFAEMQKTIDSQNAVIEGMKMKETVIATAKANTLSIPEKLVEFEGKEYKWAVPHFRHKGEVIKAEDAAIDEDILKDILSIKGQGILIEQA